jgi:hypothetical protein
MTPAQTELDRVCRERGIGDAVRSRIVRLNPNYKPGLMPRGYYPRPNRYLKFAHDLMSKGEFIHRHGRAAWDALPNGIKWRDGRRQFIGREAYLDNIWKVWAGLIPPPPMMEWYPTKKYANDKNCAVEYVSAHEFNRRRQAA